MENNKDFISKSKKYVHLLNVNINIIKLFRCKMVIYNLYDHYFVVGQRCKYYARITLVKVNMIIIINITKSMWAGALPIGLYVYCTHLTTAILPLCHSSFVV